MPKRRVNMTMDDDLFEKVRKYADRSGMSLSSSISVLVAQGLDYRSTMEALPQLLEFISRSLSTMEGQEVLAQEQARMGSA